MPDISDVKNFWNKNPLCASAIPYELGSKEYFEYYNSLREENESLDFSNKLHEYSQFAHMKVLDVGCGNGYILSKYAEHGAETFGIDISDTSIELSKKRFQFLNLSGYFSVGNAEALPFPDNHFDCVCSMGVLHHTPNTQKAIDEIHRVLKKNGKFILMLYHKNSFAYHIRMRLEKRNTGKSMQELVNEVDGIGNPKGDVYTRRSMKRLLKAYNIQTMFVRSVRLQDIYCFKNRPRLLRFIKLFEHRFGWFIYAKSTK